MAHFDHNNMNGYPISSDSSIDDLPDIVSRQTSKKLPVFFSDSDDDYKAEYCSLSERLHKKHNGTASKKDENGLSVGSQSAKLNSISDLTDNKNSSCATKTKVTSKASKPTLTKETKRNEVLKRKANQAELKSLKPEECMQRMTCNVDCSISVMLDAVNLTQLLSDNCNARFVEMDFGFPAVKWKRLVTLYQPEGQQLGSTEEVQDEPEMLVVIGADQIASMVIGCKSSPDLLEWVTSVSEQHEGFRVHVVCIGMEKYVRKVKSKANREYKRLVTQGKVCSEISMSANTKPGKNSKQNVTQQDLQDTMVQVQLSSGISFMFAENLSDFVLLVQQVTKSVAEAPYKRMKRQNLKFINEKTSVKVNAKTGEGAGKVWRQMLLQFHNVSPDMANAITAKYPSLGDLIRTYAALPVSQAENLLSDIVIRRGVGSLESQRRIGPELSKRVYRMLSAREGNEVLF